jgi:hypothetical protein
LWKCFSLFSMMSSTCMLGGRSNLSFPSYDDVCVYTTQLMMLGKSHAANDAVFQSSSWSVIQNPVKAWGTTRRPTIGACFQIPIDDDLKLSRPHWPAKTRFSSMKLLPPMATWPSL